ncbi:uncharacterized protein LOC105387747 [Plutella xylostella]|uniref:uncharacterized protein LOC105387747 n=1 Tax=Plutella xylostella TaxID=51655 RepID=UPI0020321AB9|nr:uncharacterized protein LOC105387747 [Plutella xylostella]
MVTTELLNRRPLSPAKSPSRGGADSGDGPAPREGLPGWRCINLDWTHDPASCLEPGPRASSRGLHGRGSTHGPSSQGSMQGRYCGSPPRSPVWVVPVVEIRKQTSSSTLHGDEESAADEEQREMQAAATQVNPRSDKSNQEGSSKAEVAPHTLSVNPSPSSSPVNVALAQYVTSPPSEPVWVVPILSTKPLSRPLSPSVEDHQPCDDACAVSVQAGRPRVHSCVVPNECCARALMNEHVRRAQRHLRALSKLQRLVGGDVVN